ncbi:MAG TPA: helix-turn-helix domain-containing protein [Candidatus Acidoferrales bacterium]|nr:helix-turn-helix domain-containing protein [Candidatus Acidoferrales bacterium]HXK01902.1 helix-turn-helix domain-containing protein [Verrucomicrobiae bacterium]
MKDRFDGLIDHLLNGQISLVEATGILEKSMIEGALARHRGNQCAAARALEIHRNTLQRKMVEYGLATARPKARRKPMSRAANTLKKKASFA